MLHPSITISNLNENYKQIKNQQMLDCIDFAKNQNHDFFQSYNHVIKYLKYFSKFLPFDLTNQWLLFKQNKEADEFKKFDEWKKLGKIIKKGSKASYLIEYLSKPYIVDNNDADAECVPYTSATKIDKEKLQNGSIRIVKRKTLSFVPYFGDNQLKNPKIKTNDKVTINLIDWTTEILNSLKYNITYHVSDYNGLSIKDDVKSIWIFIKDESYKELMLMRALVRVLLSMDKYEAILENTNLEEEMVSFLVMEALNKNVYMYEFNDVEYLSKILNEVDKEKFITSILNIAKTIYKKITI
ncbi:hypothetical protein [Mycoplasma phocoenae]|uniref:Uncharacterized protein n=1 Tax=Mycoplasma phocoenae TaxID=754517 RepID=A0A858U8R2_9MOLU|nr:hypothetical protein [Mycoplasma phocoenae]QJG67096.1 hypothetical protein HGG69_02110 [Mycoplasma phocoenae]